MRRGKAPAAAAVAAGQKVCLVQSHGDTSSGS